MDSEVTAPAAANPSIFNWTLGFILVGMAWGLTTPFIRKAAVDFKPPLRPELVSLRHGWLKKRVLKAGYGAIDLLRFPRYAVPLLINVTGSVWFFLLIGQAGTASLLSRLLVWL